VLIGLILISTNFQFNDCRINFSFDTRKIEEESRQIAYRVDHRGTLSVWNIPKNSDMLVEEFIRSRKPSGEFSILQFKYKLF
jgi:hypothetical protein